MIYQTGEQPNVQWHMGEFFILARFQNRGIGRIIAQQVWKKHPGAWEVTVIPENQRALQFWRKTITATVNHHFVEELKPKEGRIDPDQPNRIFLTFNTIVKINSPTRHITLTELQKKDIPVIVDSFEKASWPKPAATFEQYLLEQTSHQRAIWLAFKNTQFVGYVTLKWESHYAPFRKNNIPEIMDLNVLPNFQKQGIGSLLIQHAEQEAFKKHDTVGLGTGLYADYGQAIKMYIDRGYKPDGLGVTYNYQMVIPGNTVCLDDDLVLWFSKKRSY